MTTTAEPEVQNPYYPLDDAVRDFNVCSGPARANIPGRVLLDQL